MPHSDPNDATTAELIILPTTKVLSRCENACDKETILVIPIDF